MVVRAGEWWKNMEEVDKIKEGIDLTYSWTRSGVFFLVFVLRDQMGLIRRSNGILVE